MRKYMIFPMSLLGLMMIFTLQASVPKIHYELKHSAPQVTATGFWEVVNAPGVMNNSGTPAGMLAYNVCENGKLFNWRPSPDTSRLSGQADIIGALLSQDESLLVIAERIGGTGRNNSTRLVFINLANNKICGGMELHGRRISGIAVIPGENSKILAIQEAQSEFKNGNALLTIDLRRRRIRQITPDLEQKVTGICTDGLRVWFAFENSNRFGEVELDDSSRIRYCDTKKRVLGLNYNAAARTVIVYEPGVCEYFSINRNGLFLEKSVGLPGNFSAVWHLGIPQTANALFLVDKNNNAIMVTPGGIVPLRERMEAYGCVLADNSILIGSGNRGRIQKLSLPDCGVKGYWTPASLRPHSRNKTIYIFSRTAVPPQLVLVDERGNIFKIDLSGRRGKKTVVLLVDKNGIR